MLSGVVTAVISAITSLAVALTTQYFNEKTKQQVEKQKERDRINLTYLNPLRLHLEENYIRLIRIRQRLLEENGTCAMLMPIQQVNEIPQDETWFNADGYYLTSSCYMLACLFFCIQEVKAKIPYLQLDKKDDTELLNLMNKVSLAFARKGNIYYVVQSSIGQDMYLPSMNRVMSYREFCQALKDVNQQQWLGVLVQFYLEVGRGKKTDKVQQAIESIRELVSFLDKHLGGKTPLDARVISPKP